MRESLLQKNQTAYSPSAMYSDSGGKGSKSEDRSQKPEARSQKPEARSQKSEARSQKSEVKGEAFPALQNQVRKSYSFSVWRFYPVSISIFRKYIIPSPVSYTHLRAHE